MRLILRRALPLLLVALAALSVIWAPVLRSVHQAEVHHTRCLEHGELIEAVEAHGQAPHQDHHEPLALPGDHDQHDQHCAVDGALAQATVVRSQAVAWATAASPLTAMRLRGTMPRGPPLLRYAPKTSPPTCA